LKRLAVFVEGQAEIIFIRRLLEELATGITFEVRSLNKGRVLTVEEIGVDQNRHFALLYECGNDVRVKSAINDNIPTLEREGYEHIIGIFDLYPRSREDLPVLGSLAGINNSNIPITIVISIMEWEAWLLAEYRHFANYAGELTPEYVQERLAIDLRTLDFEDVPRPIPLVRKIYALANKKYSKKRHHVRNIVYCMDIEHFYLGVRGRSVMIDRLLQQLDFYLM
jgi:hypothetical protein